VFLADDGGPVAWAAVVALTMGVVSNSQSPLDSVCDLGLEYFFDGHDLGYFAVAVLN
jgi:hypothetical protein